LAPAIKSSNPRQHATNKDFPVGQVNGFWATRTLKDKTRGTYEIGMSDPSHFLKLLFRKSSRAWHMILPLAHPSYGKPNQHQSIKSTNCLNLAGIINMTNDFNSSSAPWNKFGHLFKRKEIPAKTILLREGEISKNGFYIEQGCIRLFFNNNGKDITFQFFFEGEGVSSVESFRTDQPSLFSIESIERSVIHTVSKRDFQKILETSPTIKKQVEDITVKRLFFYQRLFLSRIKDSPEKRYRELLENNPKLLQRVPQHYIASYLGITPVSLSRIRNRR